MRHTMMRVTLLAAVLLAILAPGSPLRPATTPLAHAASVPTGLPSHLGIGLSANPNDVATGGWLPASGIPWDYAYQYLAGGVNTGSGWETWNSSGQFPLYYAQNAAAHHYIPVFPYYELLQSTGTCGSCAEPQKDLSNLNNAGLMNSYFQNFALLMQRLGSGTYGGITGFGQTAIVHIEPDASGYAEQAVLNNGSCYGYCTGQGNNPAYLKAAVASSGYAAVAAYPNTYQGFNWALLHLRDLYAPNVLLAFHVSDWATGTDVGANSSATLNATSLGQEAGSFAAQSGISGVPAGTSSYDLLFNDVLDRDAAYYKYVFGDASRWWDRLNVTFPNFHRWESYISAASQAAGRSVIVWQIPEGNQYFDTENNTNGHYQDNRAEYFFGHLGELAQAGVIGLLFGAGNGGSTTHTDAMNDGITNPASFCTSDGMSSGQICNNHTSTVSDDDGGYLRMQGQQYYAGGGYPLGGPTPTNTPTVPATATPATPPPATATATTTSVPLAVSVTNASASPATVSAGGSEHLAATVSTTAALSGAIVDFEVYDSAGTKVFQTYQSVNFAANAPQSFQATWSVPASQATGSYTFDVGVFAAGWTSLYTWDNQAATFTVSTATATNTPVPPTSTNTPVPPAATKTNTPVPPTSTRTNTPVPPTNTATGTAIPSTHTPLPTNTWTRTSTPVPPSNTPTGTPVPPTSTATPPTHTPTATRTRTSTPVPPTRTPTPPPLVVSVTSASAAPATVSAGGSEQLAATISTTAALSGAIVDFEVYNAASTKVFQTYQSVNFTANTPQSFQATWSVPVSQAVGAYTFKIGIFAAGWASLYTWDNQAATFTVQAP